MRFLFGPFADAWHWGEDKLAGTPEVVLSMLMLLYAGWLVWAAFNLPAPAKPLVLLYALFP